MGKSKGLINGKAGQQTMGMPFGIIFAIFLIVIFIIFAFIAISHFLRLGGCGEVGQFWDNFQLKVDGAWKGQKSDFDFEEKGGRFPSGIDRICFANLSKDITNNEDYMKLGSLDINHNVFLLPYGKACEMGAMNIKHLDIEKITLSKNPYCVNIEDGLTLKKDFYDKLVAVECAIR